MHHPRMALAAAASQSVSASASPSNGVVNEEQTAQAIWTDVKKYTYSYYLGDPKFAHQGLSARCGAAVTEAEFVAKALADRERYPNQSVRLIEIPSVTDADHALVSYFVLEAALDVTSRPWVREEGNNWRNDGC